MTLTLADVVLACAALLLVGRALGHLVALRAAPLGERDARAARAARAAAAAGGAGAVLALHLAGLPFAMPASTMHVVFAAVAVACAGLAALHAGRGRPARAGRPAVMAAFLAALVAIDLVAVSVAWVAVPLALGLLANRALGRPAARPARP